MLKRWENELNIVPERTLSLLEGKWLLIFRVQWEPLTIWPQLSPPSLYPSLSLEFWVCLHGSPHVYTAQRNFQSTLAAWFCSQEVCPVTAPGIWAFSPEKSVFPGFLRRRPTLPLLGHRERRDGRWVCVPGRHCCTRPYHLRPPAALCSLAPAGECVLVWERPRKGTRLPLLYLVTAWQTWV